METASGHDMRCGAVCGVRERYSGVRHVGRKRDGILRSDTLLAAYAAVCHAHAVVSKGAATRPAAAQMACSAAKRAGCVIYCLRSRSNGMQGNIHRTISI